LPRPDRRWQQKTPAKPAWTPIRPAFLRRCGASSVRLRRTSIPAKWTYLSRLHKQPKRRRIRQLFFAVGRNCHGDSLIPRQKPYFRINRQDRYVWHIRNVPHNPHILTQPDCRDLPIEQNSRYTRQNRYSLQIRIDRNNR
jgi:hypothetical protein